jgi:hypothetical protein
MPFLLTEVLRSPTGRCAMKNPLVICTALLFVTGPAMSQNLSSGPEQSTPAVGTVQARSAGASLSLSSGRGQFIIKCADTDSTRDCVQAVLPVLPSGGGSGGVIYATTSIKCGGTTYQVSTGTSGGNCAVSGPENGPRNSAGCNDGNNTASATCDTGCGATSGSGSCTIK